jgi:hypothetical protein
METIYCRILTPNPLKGARTPDIFNSGMQRKSPLGDLGVNYKKNTAFIQSHYLSLKSLHITAL